MHRRVILATIAAVAAAVLLLGVPLGIFGFNYVEGLQRQRLLDRLDRLTVSVEAAYERDIELPDAAIERAVTGREGDIPAHVIVLYADGTQRIGGSRIEGPVLEVARTTDANVSITMAISSWQVWLTAVQVVALVAVVSALAIGVGIAIAIWQARRLSRPLVMLAASAEQIGGGQVRPAMEPSGVEEIDLVALELARSSDRFAARIAAERQFTSNASHQLRTPLTALSMRLEEIQLASSEPEIQEEARISLEQVERLATVVDDLLAQSRRSSGGTTEPVVLADIIAQQIDEWAPSFAKASRELVADVPDGMRVLATPGALSQVLATLIENSLKHGGGTTTVRCRPSGTTGAIRIEVADEGPGVPDDLAGRIFERGVTSGNGTGLGLALARDLVAADGGRLELAKRKPAVFAMFLAGVPKSLDLRVALPPGTTVSPTGRRRR